MCSPPLSTMGKFALGGGPDAEFRADTWVCPYGVGYFIISHRPDAPASRRSPRRSSVVWDWALERQGGIPTRSVGTIGNSPPHPSPLSPQRIRRRLAKHAPIVFGKMPHVPKAVVVSNPQYRHLGGVAGAQGPAHPMEPHGF